jgi:hypothetical protein
MSINPSMSQMTMGVVLIDCRGIKCRPNHSSDGPSMTTVQSSDDIDFHRESRLDQERREQKTTMDDHEGRVGNFLRVYRDVVHRKFLNNEPSETSRFVHKVSLHC